MHSFTKTLATILLATTPALLTTACTTPPAEKTVHNEEKTRPSQKKRENKTLFDILDHLKPGIHYLPPVKLRGHFTAVERLLIKLTLSCVYEKLPRSREKIDILFNKTQFTKDQQQYYATTHSSYDPFHQLIHQTSNQPIHISIDDKTTLDTHLARAPVGSYTLPTYEGVLFHELGHALTADPFLRKKISDAFVQINKNMTHEQEGFVSAYARQKHDSITALFKPPHSEDIAETIVYWLSEQTYADNNPCIRVKVAIVKQHLLQEYGP